ncbi:hypothetical protein CRYUN_Cryun38cG0010000 [Craigia yunnanensis]
MEAGFEVEQLLSLSWLPVLENDAEISVDETGSSHADGKEQNSPTLQTYEKLGYQLVSLVDHSSEGACLPCALEDFL